MINCKSVCTVYASIVQIVKWSVLNAAPRAKTHNLFSQLFACGFEISSREYSNELKRRKLLMCGRRTSSHAWVLKFEKKSLSDKETKSKVKFELTDCIFSIAILWESHDSTILASNFCKLDFANRSEFITQCLPCAIGWKLCRKKTKKFDYYQSPQRYEKKQGVLTFLIRIVSEMLDRVLPELWLAAPAPLPSPDEPKFCDDNRLKSSDCEL